MDMSMLGKVSFCLVLMLALQPVRGFAATAPVPGAQPDGQHDFDFNFGGWKTHIRRLQHPLSGSSDWTELNGSVVVNKIWDGKAQIEEIEADGPGGHFEGMTLFLYNPVAHQWGMYFANSSDGTVDQPAIGDFKDGRGEFYSPVWPSAVSRFAPLQPAVPSVEPAVCPQQRWRPEQPRPDRRVQGQARCVL